MNSIFAWTERSIPGVTRSTKYNPTHRLRCFVRKRSVSAPVSSFVFCFICSRAGSPAVSIHSGGHKRSRCLFFCFWRLMQIFLSACIPKKPWSMDDTRMINYRLSSARSRRLTHPFDSLKINLAELFKSRAYGTSSNRLFFFFLLL